MRYRQFGGQSISRCRCCPQQPEQIAVSTGHGRLPLWRLQYAHLAIAFLSGRAMPGIRRPGREPGQKGKLVVIVVERALPGTVAGRGPPSVGRERNRRHLRDRGAGVEGLRDLPEFFAHPGQHVGRDGAVLEPVLQIVGEIEEIADQNLRLGHRRAGHLPRVIRR